MMTKKSESRSIDSGLASLRIFTPVAEVQSVDLPLSHPAATSELLKLLLMYYTNTEELFLESIRRVLGVNHVLTDFETDRSPHDSNQLNLQPFRELFRDAMLMDTNLFVEEKQNLFIDEVQEAQRWIGVLSQGYPNGKDNILVSKVGLWTQDALDVLLEQATSEVDGPLGWTSTKEVFVLGMQVLLLAGVLLEWTEQSDKTKGRILRRSLELLSEVGGKMHLSVLWLDQIENTLSRLASHV